MSSSPVFVVSTGRAGSMMLARAFAQVQGIFAIHEPMPHLLEEGYLRWRDEISSDEAEERVRRKRADFISQVELNGLGYFESSHYCSHLIPELVRLFNARFVFLHRDPRGFTKSGLSEPHWYPELDPITKAKKYYKRRWGSGIKRQWYMHKLNPPSHLKTRMEKIAWLWTEINGVIIRDLEMVNPDNVFHFRLDSVGPESFSQLLDFVGKGTGDPAVLNSMLTVAQRKPNKGERKAEIINDEWDENAFVDLTQEMADMLGYQRETNKSV